MNAKFFLAVLVGSIVAFFAGWLIFGVLFPEFYGHGIKETASAVIKKPPLLWAIGISNIAWVLLITWALQKSGSTSFGKGFLTALWVSVLLIITFDFSFHAFYDIYETSFIALDVLASSVFWAIIGGIAGAILGSGKNKSA
jgi:hypothetical protein